MLARAQTVTGNRFQVTASRGKPALDRSGSIIFSSGAAGAAHVMAHRMADEGRFEDGRRWLGEWLNDHEGSGSEWIHLQFHMAVFELAIDDWNAAYTRFMDEVLPAAESTEYALTDAPALLWRLALTAPRPVNLPWDALRQTALRRMERPSDPFVTLHNLLALAGAGDVASIEQWLETRPRGVPSRPERLVERMAEALLAYTTEEYRRAAAVLREVVPELPCLGGSSAQLELFEELERSCRHRLDDGRVALEWADAA
jgi:hypothetical protein